MNRIGRMQSSQEMSALVHEVRGQGPALRRVPVCRLLEVLAGVHQAWAAPGSAFRDGAVHKVHESTGYPTAILDRALGQLFGSIDAEEMRRWLAAGGVYPAALDGEAREGFLVFGPGLTVVIASGNIPGAAVPSVTQALLLKSPCLVKSSSGEPYLLPLYAHSIAEADPEVGAALAVTVWEGEREELTAAALAEADALIAYGSSETLAALRARLPVNARFIGYGHRISFSAIGRECLSTVAAPELARWAALDVCVYDQQGCLSPQAIYVERGGTVSPEAFAELLAAALDGVSREIPRRSLAAEESAAIHQYRSRIEMRAYSDEQVRLWTSPKGMDWTAVLDPDPELGPCPLNRTAVVRPIDELEELPALAEGQRPHLLSVGLAVGLERYTALSQELGAVGVTRLTTLGRAQEPISPLHHDGVNAIAALARLTRIEDPAKTGSAS